MKENTLLIDNQNYLRFKGSDQLSAWKDAIDAVNYPVWITNAFYKDEVGDEEEFVNANGKTKIGRDRDFNLVLTDPHRNGDKNVIACVSDKYGTLHTHEVYKDLKDQLEESGIEHELKSVWVSGNGGVQHLFLQINDVCGMSGTPDNFEMMIRLVTSVDGSNSHTIQMYACNKKDNTTYYGGNWKLKARHTRTLGQRTIAFIPAINSLIKQWNETIIPTFILMFNEKFDRDAAIDLVVNIAEEAGFGKKHSTAIQTLYNKKGACTDETNSLYRINHILNKYVDDEIKKDKVDLKDKFKVNITKQIEKTLNGLRK